MSEGEKFNQNAKGFKKIEWIQVKNLSVVWAQSQRKLNSAHAQNIADNFDPEMFGTLAVTKPNGHGVFHVIDGHHRKVAVERMWGENERVPCQVFDAEDPARAAKLFDHINTARKSPQPIEIFRVRVTAEEKIQVAVNKIVLACGYSIVDRGSKDDHGNAMKISCVGSLESVYETHGGDVLKDTLNTISAIWGPDKTASSAVMVRGIGELLAEFRDIDYVRLREKATPHMPSRILGRAKQWQEIHGGTVTACVKSILVQIYNEGIKTNKKKLKPKDKE